MMIEAKKLRTKEILNSIPNDKPGLYTWWADEPDYLRLLDRLGVDRSNTDKFVRQTDNLYCIYVGIAVNESIQARLNWHVNDIHNEAKVKYGTLSTLRQSISSLISHNQYDKDGTNEFIDRLQIDYKTYDFPIKNELAKQIIENEEKQMMTDNLYILNIKDNYNEHAKDIKKQLSKLRKESK